MKLIDHLRRFVFLQKELRALSTRLNNLDCASCNGTISEEKYNRRAEKIMKRANEIAKMFGLRAYHQSDPRGCSLYFITKKMNSSNYTDGVSIYRSLY